MKSKFQILPSKILLALFGGLLTYSAFHWLCNWGTEPSDNVAMLIADFIFFAAGISTTLFGILTCIKLRDNE